MDMQELLNGCTVPNHSCVRIEDNGIVVYVDPYGLPSRTADADLIAVTHSHYDHFSPEAIDQVLKAGTEFVAPVGMEQDFAKAKVYFEKGCELNDQIGCGNIGILYANGQGVAQDFKQAKVNTFLNYSGHTFYRGSDITSPQLFQNHIVSFPPGSVI